MVPSLCCRCSMRKSPGRVTTSQNGGRSAGRPPRAAAAVHWSHASATCRCMPHVHDRQAASGGRTGRKSIRVWCLFHGNSETHLSGCSAAEAAGKADCWAAREGLRRFQRHKGEPERDKISRVCEWSSAMPQLPICTALRTQART